MAKRTPDMLAARLASPSPVTFPQLQAALGNASRPTTFRFLKLVPHLRSYNHNGRYYTHPDPRRFDRFGLLSLGDVHFSRDGTLAATVRRLVAQSADGCTQKELRARLQVRPAVPAGRRAPPGAGPGAHGRRLGLSVHRPHSPRRPAAGAPGAPRRAPRQRDRGRAGSGGHHRGAADSGPPPGRVAGAGRPPLAGACAAGLPAASERGVHPLRPRAGGVKRGLCRLLKLLPAQAREAGPPAVAVAPPRSGLTVDFPAEARRCPHCGQPLQTQKSKTRRVSTPATGNIRAREIRKHSRHCPAAPVAVSAELAGLLPRRQRFGYDLVVWVGRARYHRHH